MDDLRTATSDSTDLYNSVTVTLQIAGAVWALLEPLLHARSRFYSRDPLGRLPHLFGFRLNLPYTRSFEFSLDSYSKSFVRVTYPNNDAASNYRISVATPDRPESVPEVCANVALLETCPVERGLQNYEFQVELFNSSLDMPLRNLFTITVVYDPEVRRLDLFNHANKKHSEITLSSVEENTCDRSASATDVSTGHPGDGDELVCLSPMPGVIERVLISPGDTVKTGQAMLTLIAMKMELLVRADSTARIDQVMVSAGDTVSKGQLLVRLVEPE